MRFGIFAYWHVCAIEESCLFVFHKLALSSLRRNTAKFRHWTGNIPIGRKLASIILTLLGIADWPHTLIIYLTDQGPKTFITQDDLHLRSHHTRCFLLHLPYFLWYKSHFDYLFFLMFTWCDLYNGMT